MADEGRVKGWVRRVGPRALWFLGSTALGGGCDLQTKAWAEGTLSALPGKAMIVAPWLEFSLTYNRGTAFSFIRELGTASVVFGVLALLVVVALAVMVLRGDGDAKETVCLGAVAGGAIGNGVQRAWGTGVVDFIKVNYPWGGSWPTFNVADALIACGAAGLFVVRFWKRRRRGSTPQPAA